MVLNKNVSAQTACPRNVEEVDSIWWNLMLNLVDVLEEGAIVSFQDFLVKTLSTALHQIHFVENANKTMSTAQLEQAARHAI